MSAGVAEPAGGEAALSGVFASERRLLLGLCYRMTGSVADAEDIVQETFARAIERPPARTDEPWRPWLVRVALNLARDELRRRRRRRYKGPWLPEPIEDAELVEPSHEPERTAGRYELIESVSFAFLLALEALTPAQRAVLILCDVLDYSGAETARALELSEGNVRVLLHRARKAMAGYDAERVSPSAPLAERTEGLLGRFLAAWGARDVAGLEALLAEGVVTLNDTNGRYAAAGVPVVGRNKVARFHVGITKFRPALPRIELRRLNGVPALLASFEGAADPRLAPRFVTVPELDRDGRIRRIYTVLAPEKLERLFRSAAAS